MSDEAPTPTSAAIIPAPAKDQPRAWHWTIWMSIVLPFVVMGILVWQLIQLQPSKWCGVAVGTVTLTDVNQLPAVQSCFSLLASLLEIYRANTLALIVLIGIGNLGIIYTTLKARVNVEAWGFRGGIGGDEGRSGT